MDEIELKRRGLTVQELWDCLSESMALRHVPGLLMNVIKEEAWKDRLVIRAHRRRQFSSFKEFLESPPPDGLQTSIPIMTKICKDHDRLDVVMAIEEVDARGPGGVNNPEGIGGKSGKKIVNTLDERIDNSVPHHMSSGKLLSRLKREQPELLDSVLAGDMTIHAASVQAGFRKREYRLPHDPEAAGTYLAKRVSREWFDAMRMAFEETLRDKRE